VSILISILGFGLLVFVHELGHFLFARLTGMKVDVFSIGFGPTLYHVKRGDTTYQLALLPFGGYVKIRGLAPEPPTEEELEKELDEEEAERAHQAKVARGEATLSDLERAWGLEGPFEASDELKARLGQAHTEEPESSEAPSAQPSPPQEPEEGSFQSKGLWARFLVIAGGPLFNVLFTMAVFGGLLASNNALSVLQQRELSLRVDAPSGAALESGMKAGDVLLSVNGEALTSFFDLKDHTAQSQGAPMEIELARPPEGAPIHYEAVNYQVDCAERFKRINAQTKQPLSQEDLKEFITLECDPFEGVTLYRPVAREDWEKIPLTVTPKEVSEKTYMIGVAPTLARFGTESVSGALSLATQESLGLMKMMYEKLLGAARGREDVEVASVVKITAISADTVKMGYSWFLNFLGFLSLNLALLNLLPLPALDGGRLIFIAIEAVSRRPVPERIEALVHGIGVIFLIALTIWVTTKDILSLM
jgi:regulator of sigma E protease